ncbi:MAG: hypothetical protein ACI9EQ_001103 [Bacteroidia bacterium]|jgi:hypothetical protein
MPTIAHIVNLFQPDEASDLKLAQEVTITSMIRAKNFINNPYSIQLLSAQTETDISVVPKEFKATKYLARDVTDVQPFSKQLALPLITDILDRVFSESEAEYLVFTNVDIGLQPDFYQRISAFINDGHDAFIINRRRIPEKFSSVNQLDEMLAEKGKKHPGFDCFVFHRDLYPKFRLAKICIGVPFIGITLAQNLFCFAKNPKVFTDEHLTFHIGMELFKGRAAKEYFNYNRIQFWESMTEIWDVLDTRKWPGGKMWFPFRLIYWGIHPSLPIRLALKLEPRRWFGAKERTT